MALFKIFGNGTPPRRRQQYFISQYRGMGFTPLMRTGKTVHNVWRWHGHRHHEFS